MAKEEIIMTEINYEEIYENERRKEREKYSQCATLILNNVEILKELGTDASVLKSMERTAKNYQNMSNDIFDGIQELHVARAIPQPSNFQIPEEYIEITAEELEKMADGYIPYVVSDHLEQDDHEKWLLQRRNGIGGSDAGAIIGADKYSTSSYKAVSKLRPADIPDMPVDAQKQYTFDIGHAVEAPILLYYMRITGYRIFVDRRTFQHPKYPFMFVDTDCFALTSNGELIGIECKSFGEMAKAKWKGGVYGVANQDGSIPMVGNEGYIWQTRHSMAIMNLNRWDIVANYLDNNTSNYCIVTVYRDFEEEARLINAEMKFYESIRKGIIPTIENGDKNKCDAIIESLLHDADHKKGISPTFDQSKVDANLTEYMRAANEIERLNEEKKSLCEAIDAQIADKQVIQSEAQIAILEEMGGAEEIKARYNDVDYSIERTYAFKPKQELNFDVFKRDYASLYAELQAKNVITTKFSKQKLKVTTLEKKLALEKAKARRAKKI